MIFESQQVVSVFGYWPAFADGRIEVISLEGDALILGISYVDAETSKSAIVKLRFLGVSEVEFTDLKTENVIDALHMTGESPMSVRIEACYGLDGTFNCDAVEVLSVLPHTSS